MLQGLNSNPKNLPCKLFYDDNGSHLFEEITRLDDYYPTITEINILREHATEIAEMLGDTAVIIEYGSGASTKVKILLDALSHPKAYVPIDISSEFLQDAASKIAKEYLDLKVIPVVADYTTLVSLPELPVGNRAIFFPGSTIGNFTPTEAKKFLNISRTVCGPQGSVIIGVDLTKNPLTLHRAYNDSAGITARFNMNMLTRLNRELGANFDTSKFKHYAFYNPEHRRIEMHLVSLQQQTIAIAGESIGFAQGESIWTEASYKYSLESFAELARTAGFRVAHVWQDHAQLFSLQYLTAAV